MADADDNCRALLPARPAETTAAQWRRHKWEVEYARYFATPRRGPSTPPPPGLRRVARGKLRHHGIWLQATSPAALRVSRPSHPFEAPVLTVSIADVVFEEHFVSILNFSWPQVTCVTQCPIRGSRVVFVSFFDMSKQIQKFALRFPQLSDAESFLNCVKECSCGTMNTIPSGNDCVCEDSSASGCIASNGLHHRSDDASSFDSPAFDQRTEAPALSYHEESVLPNPEPLATNIDNIYSVFPRSFTDLLTNYSTRNEKDAVKPDSSIGTDHGPHEVCTLNASLEVAVASKEIDSSKETSEIMARMKTYMVDGSFHDMLFKLEKAIDELGGDLSL